MKLFKRVFAAATILAMSLSLVACSGSIEGKWTTEIDGEKMSYEFGEDGKGSMSVPGLTVDTTYEVEDDEITVSYEINGQKASQKFTYELDGDTLSLTLDGDTQDFERAD